MKFIDAIIAERKKKPSVSPYEKGSAHLRTEKEAAEWLGVSVFTIRRIRKRNEIGAYNIGGTFHYSIKQLETYLESKATCPNLASKSEIIGSPATPTPLSGKPLGLTQVPDKHAAHLLAQKTFTKPKKP
ncbi:helix-turn-helix domain-containing protein [Rhizobium laguerreae]|uniref:Helix-turn-helix domain-containing protein n=1 Tax=Rhizobium laguerreae TaxID=1076926 RepID=A0AB35FKJ8_9HYPH|nr:helix-turn-helix domain-containing protein [Rhizobium laguerreae]MBY3067070.1 helix-turn-helix domain-containing protein [Rhizobium laguerreae]